MNVNDNREPLLQDHLHRGIKPAQIVGWDFVGVAARHHGLRVHAEPHMIEAHGLDQRDVLGGSPAFEVFFAVTLGIVNLSEPMAGVDAVAQVSEPGRWN